MEIPSGERPTDPGGPPVTTVEDRPDADTPAPWCETVDYAKLTAAQVIAALPGLSAGELRQVEEREQAGKRRVTVLRRLAALQGQRPGSPTRIELAEPVATRRSVVEPMEDGSMAAVDAAFADWGPPARASATGDDVVTPDGPGAGMAAPDGWLEPPERTAMRKALIATGVLSMLLLALTVVQALLR
jgi:hypothetical protein